MIARLDSSQVEREADDDPRSRSSRKNVIQQHTAASPEVFFIPRALPPTLVGQSALANDRSSEKPPSRVHVYYTPRFVYIISTHRCEFVCAITVRGFAIVSSCPYVCRV
jgi:hypothetical protein